MLPITVQGTRLALPRGQSRSARGADVRVTIHPAIDVTRYDQTNKGIAALAEDVRAAIASGL